MASYNSMKIPCKAQEILGLRSHNSMLSSPGSSSMLQPQERQSHKMPVGQPNRYEGNRDGRRSPFSLQMPLQSSLYILPLTKRCHNIETIIASCPSSDLHDSFPDLVANIFGISGHSGWQLHLLNPIQDCYDYHEVRRFLSPVNGSLFKIIDQLVTEHSAMYPLSLANLPVALQTSLQHLTMERKGYHSYSHTFAEGQTIEINALEYYFFYFAMFVTQIGSHQDIINWSSVDGVLYAKLLEDYLNHFLPIHTRVIGNTQSPAFISRHQSQSRQDGSFSPYFKQQQQQYSDTQWQITNNTKSESFLKLLIDVWLSLAPMSPQREKRSTSMSQDFYLPSVDHVRFVRQLIKHTHNFANSKIATPAHIDASLLETGPHAELQRKAISMLAERLYPFLRHLFVYWPIDPSFRMVLETWLSFIQPWRYPESNASPSPTRGYAQQPATPINVELSFWVNFISEHVQFYSSLLKVFISRAMCLDFETPKDAQLLYRVTKVFSQPRLGHIIADAEPIQYDSSTLRNSFSSTNPLAINSFDRRRSHFSPTDRMDEHSNPSEVLFGDLYRPVVIRLAEKLASSLACARQRRSSLALQRSRNESISILKSLANSLKSFFLMNDDTSFANELELAANYTDRILADLCCLFKIERPSTETSRFHSNDDDDRCTIDRIPTSLPRPKLRHRHSIQSRLDCDGPPDHVMTEHGPILTYKGKTEVINGVRSFDIDLFGDPDLQPIRSFESSYLVRCCHALSECINSRFAYGLSTLYFRCGFMSFLLQWLNVGSSENRNPSPRRIQRNLNSSLPSHDTTDASMHRVRVSFRYLASYYTLVYMFLLSITLWLLFGFHPFTVSMVILLLLILLLSVHIRSDI